MINNNASKMGQGIIFMVKLLRHDINFVKYINKMSSECSHFIPNLWFSGIFRGNLSEQWPEMD